MEAGSKIMVLKGQNFIFGKEIFAFLPCVILNPFRTNFFNLISFMKKGVLKSVFIGFVFLFLFVCSPVSGLLDAFSHQHPILFQHIKIQLTDKASKAMIVMSESKIPILPKTTVRHAYASHLNETPGFATAEAPSSQLDFPGKIASKSSKLNQTSCL